MMSFTTSSFYLICSYIAAVYIHHKRKSNFRFNWFHFAMKLHSTFSFLTNFFFVDRLVIIIIIIISNVRPSIAEKLPFFKCFAHIKYTQRVLLQFTLEQQIQTEIALESITEMGVLCWRIKLIRHYRLFYPRPRPWFCNTVVVWEWILHLKAILCETIFDLFLMISHNIADVYMIILYEASAW